MYDKEGLYTLLLGRHRRDGDDVVTDPPMSLLRSGGGCRPTARMETAERPMDVSQPFTGGETVRDSVC